MVKNTTGGSKHKKQKNSSVKQDRPLIIKQDANEEYGQVMTFLGGSMVMVRKLGTKLEVRCRLRKSLPRVNKKDYVLYALREFCTKDNIGDVMLVYSTDEVLTLKKEKYIEEEVEDELFRQDEENEEDKDKEENENIEVEEINMDEL